MIDEFQFPCQSNVISPYFNKLFSIIWVSKSSLTLFLGHPMKLISLLLRRQLHLAQRTIQDPSSRISFPLQCSVAARLLLLSFSFFTNYPYYFPRAVSLRERLAGCSFLLIKLSRSSDHLNDTTRCTTFFLPPSLFLSSLRLL